MINTVINSPVELRTTHAIKRVAFDPTNAAHRRSAEKFFNGGTWGDIQFYAERPYLTVADTVTARLLPYYFKGDKAVTKKAAA